MGTRAQPKFRYIVVSLFDGKVRGTNNRETAESWAVSEEDWIVDIEHLYVDYDDSNLGILKAVDIEELPQIEPTAEENENGN